VQPEPWRRTLPVQLAPVQLRVRLAFPELLLPGLPDFVRRLAALAEHRLPAFAFQALAVLNSAVLAAVAAEKMRLVVVIAGPLLSRELQQVRCPMLADHPLFRQRWDAAHWGAGCQCRFLAVLPYATSTAVVGL